jgi:hypothetical protein
MHSQSQLWSALMQIERPAANIQLKNKSTAWAAFYIGMRAPEASAEGSIPEWLDIFPNSGYIEPRVCIFSHPFNMLLFGTRHHLLVPAL